MEIVKTCRRNIDIGDDAERERERQREGEIQTAVRSKVNRAESRWTVRQVGRVEANRINGRVAFLRSKQTPAFTANQAEGGCWRKVSSARSGRRFFRA